MPEIASTQATTYRNLLFAVVTLQSKSVSELVLVEALNFWALHKSLSLGDILVERDVFSVDDQLELEAKVHRCLEEHGGDTEKCLASLRALKEGPLFDLSQIEDEFVRAGLSSYDKYGTTITPKTATVSDSVPWPGPVVPPSMESRYRKLREIATDGMGSVWLARDEELDREVALKEIKPDHSNDADFQARFLREAKVTGGLEHPGIVPVYGLGAYRDGRPYYAMRFIKGQDLRQALERFHANGKDGPERGEWTLRKLLDRFIDMCNAVAYAHSRGWLHRDLKPANVMLGPYGETLVVDWGLAKKVGRPEKARELEPTLGTLHIDARTDSSPTQGVLGTPAYMSPEQAAGMIEELRQVSDVYSLGATLYHVLTGKTAFDGGRSVLPKVLLGDFRPPREVNDKVPPALEAICLKAMALKPEARYESALDLAEDVKRWLSDEPVLAYPPPFVERTRRWARRHRPAVTAAAAALLVALVALTTGTVVLTREYHKEADAREQAQSRFLMAREAVDNYFTKVSESDELKEKNLEQLRTRLLESAREFYTRLAREPEGIKPEFQAEHGNILNKLGNIYLEIDRNKEAFAQYEAARKIRHELSTAFPENVEYQNDLAKSYLNLATVSVRLVNDSGAEANFANAIRLGEQMIAAHPDQITFQYVLGRAYNDFGLFRDSQGRSNEGLQWYEKALSLWKRVVASQPENPEYARWLAGVQNNIGMIYAARGKFDDAKRAYEQARDIDQSLADKHPTTPIYKEWLSNHDENLARLYLRTGRNDDALQSAKRVLQIREQLVQNHMGIAHYQELLSDAYTLLAAVYVDTNRLKDSLEMDKKALDINKWLAENYPDVPDFQSALAVSYERIGLHYGLLDDHKLAVENCRHAVDICEKLVRDFSDNSRYKASLKEAYVAAAGVYTNAGRLSDAFTVSASLAKLYALEQVENARAISEHASDEHPGVSNHQPVNTNR